MVSIISTDALRRAQALVPCRQNQLQKLAIYYNHHLPSPPVLIVHGLEHTDKLETVVALLKTSGIRHAVVKSKDTLSQRHLLTKIFSACVQQLEETENIERYDRLDSLNSLVVNLQRLFANRDGKFVLVIEGIDRQRGASYSLLPALARLGDLVPTLSLILTSSSSQSIPLHRSGIPFVHFPPYTRSEAIYIVTKQTPDIPSKLPMTFPAISETQVSSIYKSFVVTVYDTLTAHTSSTSLQTFSRTCEKLWPRFIWPMLSGEAPSGKNTHTSSSAAKWDFARLLSRGRHLFQREGERALLPRLTSDPTSAETFEQLLTKHENASEAPTAPVNNTTKPPEPRQETPLLKSFSTLLLVSSYLASHTPPKHDIILFSRLSSSSTNKRKYLASALSKSRVGGGIRKTPTKKRFAAASDPSGEETPSKKRKSGDETVDGLAAERTPKSTRLLLEKTSNIPRPFALERVVAILRTVHPDGLPRTRGAADKVYGEMAELERLRLVVRHDGAGARGVGDDGILEEKWRVNVGREFVLGVGRWWGMSLEGWEID